MADDTAYACNHLASGMLANSPALRLQQGDQPTWAAFVAPIWREITNVPSLGDALW